MEAALVYVGGLLVLFFFWIYGIVAFVRDLKNRVVPAVHNARRRRRERSRDAAEDRDRAEEERQLY